MLARLRSHLSSDSGLTSLLVSLSVVIFVVYPFVPLGAAGRTIISVGLTLILLSGSFSLGDRRGLMMVALGLAGVALATRWLSHFNQGTPVLVTFLVSSILFLGITAGGVLAKVLREGRVTSHRIQGAIAAYLLLGLLWGFAYSLVELRRPGSFDLPVAPAVAEVTRTGAEMSDLVYFSFVTLTTLGYGDVTPVTSGARTLAMLEALVGQLFLVTLIARLVSARAAGSRNRD